MSGQSECGVIASVLTEAEAEKGEVDRWRKMTDDRFFLSSSVHLVVGL